MRPWTVPESLVLLGDRGRDEGKLRPSPLNRELNSDRQNFLTRRDILTDRQIRLARDRNVVEPRKLQAATAIPTELRRKLIRKQLDLIIDHVLIGE